MSGLVTSALLATHYIWKVPVHFKGMPFFNSLVSPNSHPNRQIQIDLNAGHWLSLHRKRADIPCPVLPAYDNPPNAQIAIFPLSRIIHQPDARVLKLSRLGTCRVVDYAEGVTQRSPGQGNASPNKPSILDADSAQLWSIPVRPSHATGIWCIGGSAGKRIPDSFWAGDPGSPADPQLRWPRPFQKRSFDESLGIELEIRSESFQFHHAGIICSVCVQANQPEATDLRQTD